jgi:hypothetical protein
MTTDPDSPTIVYEAENAIEAGAIVTSLEAEGIETTTTGLYTSGFQAEAPGPVRVVVRQSQADKARHILEELKREAAFHQEDEDEEEVDE